MTLDPILTIKNLHARIDSREILKGFDLEIMEGETHYLMGKNGAGKSTVAKVIMGHPSADISKGKIEFNGNDITELETSERSIKGIYLANQYPVEVPGVNMFNFLRLAYNARCKESEQLSVFRFRKHLKPILELLNIKREFLDRNLNEGFSGGEKKKSEILQMAVLSPKFVILDETDSGLDVDSLKEVFSAISKLKAQNPKLSLLIITHYNRVADYLEADKVHILKEGKISRSGGREIVDEIEEKGYE